MRIKGNAIHSDLNHIFLSGEVVDFGVSPRKHGIVARVRLKVKLVGGFALIDVYGGKRCSDTMTLICQTGNVLYVEGEFRNAVVGQNVVKPYILVKEISCVRRSQDIKAPSTDIIKVLDMLNPLGGDEREVTKRKKTKSNRTAPVQELERVS